MERWIRSITGTIPHTNKTVNIDLAGRNLIVTGANGSGKTSMLKSMYDKIILYTLNKEWINVKANEEQIKLWESYITDHSIGFEQKTNAEWEIKKFQSNIDAINNSIILNIPEADNLAVLQKGKKAIINLFEEKRLSEIFSATTAIGLSMAEENAKQQNPLHKFGNNLEQHLVNLINRQSLAITKDKDIAFAERIEIWFSNFKRNLKILFEDDSLTLDYDTDNFKFYLKQDGKPSFTFQTLSAGYRAIFDIYAELIMRTEYFKVMPQDLTGVVLIDEIDSHLHVSLQRLILPFFTNSFPNVQFIVTTHSPFVLMSTPDTIVFDLAKNEPITEDLSYYTYSAVMKGLWNVKPISVTLENAIKELSVIINSPQKDYQRLAGILGKLKKYEDVLDNQSKTLFLLGVDVLEEAGTNV